jgi:uncharacterized protein GlcG (DUF336 family)
VDLEEAEKMVNAAIAKAKELGIKCTFAIVDESGYPILVKRMDGAAWITVDLAIGKAYTAVAFRLIGERFDSSATVGKYFSDTPSLLYSLGVSSHGKIIGRGGGLPIIKDGKVVGAIGVSGGTHIQDEECAQAAIKALL